MLERMEMYLPAPPVLVLWPSVTAVAIVVRDDGIVLTADRGTVIDPTRTPEGSVLPGPDASKVGVTAGGCVWGLAGHAATSAVDLRSIVAATSDHSPAAAATAVRRQFNGVADAIRQGAWCESTFLQAEMSTVVHSVAVIVGVLDGRPEAHLVGLTVNGPCTGALIGGGAVVVLAPQSVTADLVSAGEAALLAAGSAAAAELMRSAIVTAATFEPELISPHLDQVTVTERGPSPIVTYHRRWKTQHI